MDQDRRKKVHEKSTSFFGLIWTCGVSRNENSELIWRLQRPHSIHNSMLFAWGLAVNRWILATHLQQGKCTSWSEAIFSKALITEIENQNRILITYTMHVPRTECPGPKYTSFYSFIKYPFLLHSDSVQLLAHYFLWFFILLINCLNFNILIWLNLWPKHGMRIFMLIDQQTLS